jgi:hypothetical protein
VATSQEKAKVKGRPNEPHALDLERRSQLIMAVARLELDNLLQNGQALLQLQHEPCVRTRGAGNEEGKKKKRETHVFSSGFILF